MQPKPRRWMLLQLLLLASAATPALSGLLDSYIVEPLVSDLSGSGAEYKHVTAQLAASSSQATAPCSSSADGSCVPPPAHGAPWLGAVSTSTMQETSSSREAWPMHNRELLQATANPLRLQVPYNVCVSSWAPMVRCMPGDDQAAFKGYQIELFRMTAKEVGWADEDYVFTCMDYSSMMADLLDPAGNCSLSAAGVEVFPDNLAAGLKFTWPTYKSGLRVMIHADLQSGSTWAFSEIFHWEVWLMLGATAIIVGLLVEGFEVANAVEAGQQHGGDKPKGWHAWEWYSLAKMVHVVPHVGDPRADASRVLILGYGLLVLVMVSMYTAVAASRITAATLVHPIHTQKDLQGDTHAFKVLTWSQYVPALQNHQQIQADGVAWERDRGEKEREGDLQGMLELLRSHTYDALILDAPVLEYVAGTNEACDLFLVGDVLESFSLALAFPPAFSDAAVFDFSRSIVKLQTYQGALDMLDNVYVKTGGTEKCFGSSAGGHGSGDTIELRQVSGLWYILLMTVGLCLVFTLAHNIRKDPQKLAQLRRMRSSFVGSAQRRDRGGSSAGDTFLSLFSSAPGGGVGSTRTSGAHVWPAPAAPAPAQQHAASQQEQQTSSEEQPAECSVPEGSNASGVGGIAQHKATQGSQGSQQGPQQGVEAGGSIDGRGPAGGQGSTGLLAGSPHSPQQQQQQQSPRKPSALQVFLGHSKDFFGSDDEQDSPTSPKKMHHPHH